MQEIRTTPFHKIFESVCIEFPDNIALIFNQDHLTYKQLNEKANQFANSLSQKYPKGSYIAVKLMPSIDAIVTTLALMKAGLVYVPIPADTDISGERLKQCIEDCKPVIIITSESIASLIDNTASKENPSTDVQPNDLAYVMYSSGTTGRPKGVKIAHKGLYAPMKSHHDIMNMHGPYVDDNKERQHCIAQFASLGFDASIMEIMVALGIGARLCIIPYELRKRPEALCKYYRENKVSAAIFTPSMMREIPPASLPELKVVLGMGENLPQNILDEWAQKKRFVIGYGPTEVSIASSLGVLERGDAIHAGKSVLGLEFFVENKNEVGEGELWIAGNGLAEGYINNPELDKKHFAVIPHPNKSNQMVRVYKTGDLVKLNKDGNLEIKGRLDRQVKIYGKLIQPEAIDEVLQKHTGVSKAYTDIEFNKNGHPIITAYIVLKNGTPPSDIDLHVFYESVKQSLSQTMAPTRYVLVNEIPINSRGKLDTTKLKESKLEVKHIRPASAGKREKEFDDELTNYLKKLWADLLPLKNVFLCPEDNFYHLGGTSLLVINLLSIIKDKFNVVINIDDFLSNPTLGTLARKIRRKQNPEACIAPIIELAKGDNKPPYVFFGHTLFCDSKDYEKFVKFWDGKQKIYAIDPCGLKDQKFADETIEEAAQNYIEAIKKIQPEGPYIIAGWSLGGMLAYEIARQLRINKQKVEVMMIDTESPFCIQEMNEQEFINHLQDLHARICPHFKITANFERSKLVGKNKQQQIDLTFEMLLNNITDINLRNKLWTIRCFLIAVLNYHPVTNDFTCSLIAASQTQAKWNNRLKWPDFINIKNIDVVTGDHFSIFSREDQLQKLIEYQKRLIELAEARFKLSPLIEEQRKRYPVVTAIEPLNNIAELSTDNKKLLIIGDDNFNKSVCLSVMRQWTTGRLHQFDLVMYLDAKKLTKELYPPYMEVRLEDIIVRQCIGDWGSPIEKETIRYYLRPLSSKLLFVIENYEPHTIEPRCREIINEIVKKSDLSVITTSEYRLALVFDKTTIQTGYMPMIADSRGVMKMNEDNDQKSMQPSIASKSLAPTVSNPNNPNLPTPNTSQQNQTAARTGSPIHSRHEARAVGAEAGGHLIVLPREGSTHASTLADASYSKAGGSIVVAPNLTPNETTTLFNNLFSSKKQ